MTTLKVASSPSSAAPSVKHTNTTLKHGIKAYIIQQHKQKLTPTSEVDFELCLMWTSLKTDSNSFFSVCMNIFFFTTPSLAASKKAPYPRYFVGVVEPLASYFESSSQVPADCPQEKKKKSLQELMQVFAVLPRANRSRQRQRININDE